MGKLKKAPDGKKGDKDPERQWKNVTVTWISEKGFGVAEEIKVWRKEVMNKSSGWQKAEKKLQKVRIQLTKEAVKCVENGNEPKLRNAFLAADTTSTADGKSNLDIALLLKVAIERRQQHIAVWMLKNRTVWSEFPNAASPDENHEELLDTLMEHVPSTGKDFAKAVANKILKSAAVQKIRLDLGRIVFDTIKYGFPEIAECWPLLNSVEDNWEGVPGNQPRRNRQSVLSARRRL